MENLHLISQSEQRLCDEALAFPTHTPIPPSEDARLKERSSTMKSIARLARPVLLVLFAFILADAANAGILTNVHLFNSEAAAAQFFAATRTGEAKCMPLQDKVGPIDICILEEPGYGVPIALRYNAGPEAKDIPILIFLNGKRMNFEEMIERSIGKSPTETPEEARERQERIKFHQGFHHHKGSTGSLFLGAIEMLINTQDRERIAKSRFSNNYLWIQSGDHILVAVDQNENGAWDSVRGTSEPYAEFNLTYTAKEH